MGLSHLEPAYTDKASGFVEEFGGKLGGLQYLLATAPDLAPHILPMQVVKPGQAYADRPTSNNLIARASHSHDFQGLVNVIDSTSFNVLKQKIERVIEEIRIAAKDDLVMRYAQYENPTYDGNVVIGIQPHLSQETLHSKDYRRGSVVEHPNYPGKYLIEWIEEWKGLTGGMQREITSGLYDDNGNQVAEYNTLDHPPKNAVDLVKLYQRIRASELVRDDITFQMEFGSAPEITPLIYQVRAFMKRTVPDFTFDADDDFYMSLAIGCTGPEGITLPVFIQGRDAPAAPNDPIAVLTPRPTDWRNLEFQPAHIGAYLAGRMHGRSATPNLQHGNFWKAQKADVTVFEPRGGGSFDILVDPHSGRLRDVEEGPQNRMVHIVSDGLRASLTPVE